MTPIDSGRRKLLRASGAALTLAAAGCVGGDDEVPEEVDAYLEDANGYDGSVADRTGQNTATVDNGANDPDYAFEPAAIRVDAGTDVTWEWVAATAHSVTHDDGEFESGTQDEEDATFSHTFEDASTYLYYCVPHKAQGQKGAVIVE